MLKRPALAIGLWFGASLLAACSPSAETASPAGRQETLARHPESGLEVRELTIKSGSATHRFVVEMARTPQEQAKGLMFRTSLEPNAGMLFPRNPAAPASFWMKNTVIPLDIIFIDAQHKIESIAANAQPYSLDPIASGGPVIGVLELAGGRAAELGLASGDTVSWTN